MKRFVTLCFLVGYAHAITCIDAVLMERKNELSGFVADDGAYLDSSYAKYGIGGEETVSTQKITRLDGQLIATRYKKRGDEVRMDTAAMAIRKSESEVDGSVEYEMVVRKDQVKDTLNFNLMYYHSGKKVTPTLKKVIEMLLIIMCRMIHFSRFLLVMTMVRLRLIPWNITSMFRTRQTPTNVIYGIGMME